MEINQESLKEILKEQREEYQRYLGVLKKNFDSKIQLIAESVSGIQAQLIAIRDMVVKNTEDIQMIKMDIEMMRADIEIIKTDIVVIKNGLKKKVDVEEFEVLERRVPILEAKKNV